MLTRNVEMGWVGLLRDVSNNLTYDARSGATKRRFSPKGP